MVVATKEVAVVTTRKQQTCVSGHPSLNFVSGDWITTSRPARKKGKSEVIASTSHTIDYLDEFLSRK